MTQVTKTSPERGLQAASTPKFKFAPSDFSITSGYSKRQIRKKLRGTGMTLMRFKQICGVLGRNWEAVIANY